MSDITVSEEIRRNFHLFWDNFPFPVMLVYKDRTILEANEAGRKIGCPVGNRCVDIGEKKHHAGCQANQALSAKSGKRSVGYIDHLGIVMDSYWLPLAGVEDCYVHFGIDITEYAGEHMFPKKDCAGKECSSCSGE